MRIKEFFIRRYEPLPERGRIKLSDFNLIYGVNETGKTLTLEALIKMLLGKASRKFKRIDRVEEYPEGYIIINTPGGDIKLPEKGYIFDITNLSPSECRNIFIIRNSDLSIEEDTTFYTEITDRLTGLKSKEIGELKDKIIKLVRITPTYHFSDKKEDNYLKKRINESETLLETIENLSREIEEENLVQIEKEYMSLSEEIKLKAKLRKKYDNARRRKQYEKGSKSLKMWNEAFKKKDNLEKFTNEEFQEWRDAQRDIKRLNKDLNFKTNELNKKEETRRELDNKIEELKFEFEGMRNIKEIIDELHPQINELKGKKIELTAREEAHSSYGPLIKIFSILTGISIIGLIVKFSILFSIISGIFIATLFFLLFLYGRLKIARALLSQDLERIRIKLTESGIEGKTIEEIIRKTEEFRRDFEKKEELLRDKEVVMLSLRNETENIRNKVILKINNEIESNEEIIEKIKDSSLSFDIEEYKKQFDEKIKCESIIKEQEEVLKSLFGDDNWEEKIDELSLFADSASDLEYDEKKAKELDDEIEHYTDTLKELEIKMNDLKDKLQDIEGKAKYILSDEEIRCDGTGDLKRINSKINEFVQKNKNRKDDATNAIEILDEIKEEEKTKIVELFGEGSSVSTHFSKITNGLYTKVDFDKDINSIVTTLKDGTKLTVEKLSGGAYDQLYLSIRLALGEKLLSGEKGFFILDDPFIKASPDRLKTQLNTLKHISKQGWQIIYLSAKGEVKEALYKDIENKSIKYIPLGKTIL